MHKKIEEKVLSTTKSLTKKYGLNESYINKLTNILIKIAQNYFGEQFNSVETTEGTDLDLTHGLWLQPDIYSYFSKIPSNKVFEIFENNNINDLIALEHFFKNLDFGLLFIYEELNNIIKPFITYLLNNRNEIKSTGFPLKSFELSYWFYNNLSRLYPLKQPYAILRKEKDKDGNFLLEYHWIKRPGNLFYSSNLKKQDFLNAPYNLLRFSFSAIDLIENKRPMLFELKIEILNILSDALLDKNCLDLWKKCIRCIADKVELEDFKHFIAIGEINYFYPEIYSKKTHENLFKKYNMSGWDYFFEQGGLTQIMELIFQVEKELRLGHINKIKNTLLTLGKNKIISTYYDLLLNIDLSELFTIGEELREYQKEENEYRNFFEKRLSNNLKKLFKTSLSDKPDISDSIEEIINSLRNNINSKRDLTESRNTFKANTNNIIPIKLPPNTKWDLITIQFIDNETIRITGPESFSQVVTFREMGFENRKKRGRPPTVLWDFLRALAHTKGTFSWDLLDTRTRNSKTIKDAMDNATKRKQLVNQKLKAKFNLKEDPIIYDRKKKIYTARFAITSENELF